MGWLLSIGLTALGFVTARKKAAAAEPGGAGETVGEVEARAAARRIDRGFDAGPIGDGETDNEAGLGDAFGAGGCGCKETP